MSRLEYRRVESAQSLSVEELNALAVDGWELVESRDMAKQHADGKIEAFVWTMFKRPAPDSLREIPPASGCTHGRAWRWNAVTEMFDCVDCHATEPELQVPPAAQRVGSDGVRLIRTGMPERVVLADIANAITHHGLTLDELRSLFTEDTKRPDLLVCGHMSGASNWPCSKAPGHHSRHENAFAHWPRTPGENCAPAATPTSPEEPSGHSPRCPAVIRGAPCNCMQVPPVTPQPGGPPEQTP